MPVPLQAKMLVASLLVAISAGCHREFYRKRADRDVTRLVNEKSCDPRWGLPGFTIQQDPRSRYFENYSIDRPPMPEDDPVSHQFMHRVGCMRGWPHWGRDGIRATLDNPQWRQRLPEYVPTDAQGQIQLDLETALRLAYMHSPDHQSQLETIYLSALDVSTERFRLQTQFFGGNDTFYRHEGRLRGPGGEINRLTTDTDLRLERRFATAGELLVGFANSIVWQFAGPDTYTSASVVNLALVQPLLRNAGRSVALEQLTIVERGLLANLRAYQRYRQGFYSQVAVGDSGGVVGPQRRGGFFGGTGLTGFTGTGAGGLGGVGAITGFGRGGFAGGFGGGGGGGAGFAGGGAGQLGGFLGLLQASQEIRNTEVSLESQVRTLSLLEANLEAGIIDLTQVDQFRQNIETERATLLQSRIGLSNGVENYLAGTLGLPPDVPVKLDDSLIRQFQFLDSRTVKVQSSLEQLQDQLGEYIEAPAVDVIDQFCLTASQQLDGAKAVAQITLRDLEKAREQTAVRERGMAPQEKSLYESDLEQLEIALAGLQQRLKAMEPLLETVRQNASPETRREAVDKLVIWLRQLLVTVQGISLVQARARVEAIALEPVELDADEAFRIATAYRLDIMNNRAALVDSWRLIQFNAKRLQSDLQIVLDGDIRTVGDKPFRFRGPTGALRAGVQFDAPFTRLLERNSYRQQIIEYQQDRRQLIRFYDGLQLGLRQLLRDMEQLRVNMEIQRRAVVIAIRRVDLTREELAEPTPPPQPGQPASQLGPTAALNLLTALSDLRNTQNNFMSVWLRYYADRMRLMLDLGLMQLDEQGNWIDVPLEQVLACGVDAEEVELPPAIPHEWMRQAFENAHPPARPATEPRLWTVDARSGKGASELWSR